MEKANQQKGLSLVGFLGILVLIGAAGLVYWSTREDSPKAPVNGNGSETSGELIIRHTDQGFVPASLTVSAGETVVFKNESSRSIRPASDVHPLHTGYPGTDIKNCATAEAGTMFDPCAPIAPGDSWSFTFNEKGEWSYHNHMGPTEIGKVIVE